MAVYTYAELQGLSIEQLKAQYDKIAIETQTGLYFYRDEIARREADEQNKRMLELSEQMKWWTVFVGLLTVVNVIAALVPLFR